MPTYLRWIASMTAGVTAYFTYSILTFGIARANDVTELRGAVGSLIALGTFFVVVLPALAVNDWLAKRYPKQTRASSERDEADIS